MILFKRHWLKQRFRSPFRAAVSILIIPCIPWSSTQTLASINLTSKLNIQSRRTFGLPLENKTGNYPMFSIAMVITGNL